MSGEIVTPGAGPVGPKVTVGPIAIELPEPVKDLFRAAGAPEDAIANSVLILVPFQGGAIDVVRTADGDGVRFQSVAALGLDLFKDGKRIRFVPGNQAGQMATQSIMGMGPLSFTAVTVTRSRLEPENWKPEQGCRLEVESAGMPPAGAAPEAPAAANDGDGLRRGARKGGSRKALLDRLMASTSAASSASSEGANDTDGEG